MYLSKFGDQHRTEKVCTVKQIYSAHLVLCREAVTRQLHLIYCIVRDLCLLWEWIMNLSQINFISHLKQSNNSCSNFMVAEQFDFLNRNF